MTLIVVTGTDYRNVLASTSFDISIISIACCLWVIGIFVLSGKWRRVPHSFAIALMFSHIIACSGMILFYCFGETKGWQHYVIIICLLVGVFATRCWTAVIAVVLCLLHVRSLCYVLRKRVWFYFLGFGIPVFTTGLLFMLGSHDIGNEIDPTFHYGSLQTSFSLLIVTLSIIITITSLVWWQRTEKHATENNKEQQRLRQESVDSCRDAEQPGSDYGANGGGPQINSSAAASKSIKNYTANSGDKTTWKKSSSIEDLIPYPSSDYDSSSDLMQNISERTCLLRQCSTEQRHACMDRLRVYTANVLVNGDSPQEMDVKTPKEMNKEEYQTVHHLILLLLLLLSMFIGMFLCIWRVFNHQPTGIYVEIEFLDCVFNYGQGVLVLIVFGFDTRLVFSPIVRSIYKLAQLACSTTLYYKNATLFVWCRGRASSKTL
jgi:hypothetical protein